MSGNVNPPRAIARLGTSGGPFCQAAHAGANQVNPASSARPRSGEAAGPGRSPGPPLSGRAQQIGSVRPRRPNYPRTWWTARAPPRRPAPRRLPRVPPARRPGAKGRLGPGVQERPAGATGVPSLDCGTAAVAAFPCCPQSRPEGSPDAAGRHGGLASMMTFGTLGGIMEKMTSRLAAAAVVAGVAVLGAGCAADAAAPAGGNPGSAPAGSPALPNPFTITARYR